MSKRLIPTFILAAINHVISQETWALEIINKHLGKVLQLNLPMGGFTLAIRPGGFSNSENESEAQVTLDVAQDAIGAFVAHGKVAASKHVRIAGDVDLAHDLSTLASNLRWEAEEDLSKWIGDAAAHRVGLETRKFLAAGKKARLDLQGGIRDYLVHEKRTLIETPEFDLFKKDIRELRDAVERSEKRIERLIRALDISNKTSGA